MKAKQIEKLLTGLVKNLLESIKDEEIKKIIKEKSFITGGCIPCALMDLWINDFDFYFYTKEDANKIKKYYQEVQKSDKFHVKLITDNAINLSDKVQLITRFVGGVVQVTDNFDWQHIKSWYDCNSEKLTLTNDVYRLICEKELVYTGSAYPLSSMFRLKKYLKKGWNVSNTTILKIVFDILKEFNKTIPTKGTEATTSKNIDSCKQEPMEDSPEQEFIDELYKEEQNLTDNEEGLIDRLEEEMFFKKESKKFSIDVDTLIDQMNGVDPVVIQRELINYTGKTLTIEEIIRIMENQ